jgi:hypothetical protein
MTKMRVDLRSTTMMMTILIMVTISTMEDEVTPVAEAEAAIEDVMEIAMVDVVNAMVVVVNAMMAVGTQQISTAELDSQIRHLKTVRATRPPKVALLQLVVGTMEIMRSFS